MRKTRTRRYTGAETAVQEALQRNDGGLSPPVLSSSGRLSPVRMAQLTPSIAANSNKQDFFFFSHGEVIQGMKVPRSGGYF